MTSQLVRSAELKRRRKMTDHSKLVKELAKEFDEDKQIEDLFLSEEDFKKLENPE